jgi:hypothetical protein
VDSVTLRPGFTHGKGPPVPIVQEAGWVPEPVWTQRLEEKSFAPAGDRTPIARYQLYRRLGGVPEPVWTQRLEEKSFAEDRKIVLKRYELFTKFCVE